MTGAVGACVYSTSRAAAIGAHDDAVKRFFSSPFL